MSTNLGASASILLSSSESQIGLQSGDVVAGGEPVVQGGEAIPALAALACWGGAPLVLADHERLAVVRAVGVVPDGPPTGTTLSDRRVAALAPCVAVAARSGDQCAPRRLVPAAGLSLRSGVGELS